MGIELLFLPTYAPWTNPVEKLWKKLKQEVVCLHRFADAWEGLKQKVRDFLQALILPSSATATLLRYVGLVEHDGNQASTSTTPQLALPD